MTRLTTLLLSLLALLGASAARAQADVPPGVVVEALHIAVSRAGDRLLIEEEYFVGNRGDATYAGAPNADGVQTTLSFTLPPDASALTFDGPGLGERYVGDAQQFADTQPVPHGSATSYTRFSYELPFREGLTLARRVAVQVAGAVILVRDERLTLAGEQVTPMGTLDTQNGPAQAYVAGPLAAAEPLALTFTAVAAPQPAGRNYVAETGLGLIALSAGLGIAYRLWNSAASHTITPPSAPPAALRAQIQAIAALDADFAAHTLEASDYRRRRARLKQTLREALRDKGSTA